MPLKERTIVSAFALLGSLSAYYYAKTNAKDPTPFLMLGGFMGALIGESITPIITKNEKQKQDPEQGLLN